MAYQSHPYHAPAQSSYSHPTPSSNYFAPPGPSHQPYYGYQHGQPSHPQHQAGPASAAPYDAFRTYYADRLRELTFNSRPLIQELSVLAMQQRDQQQWGNMTAVVEEIEGAVYRSPPHEKLPKLYLLDSISKNVGPPYTTHLLQQTIPRLYIRTHREVDGVTKVKMEEMISLWRRSGPNGTELYGAGPREAVEREIFGGAGGGSGGGPGSGVGMHGHAPVREIITRDGVISAIHSMIGVKQGEAAQKPWDRAVQMQLTALMGLSEMLNTRQVQPAELQQIMDQLRGMGYVQAPPPTQPPIPAPYTQQSNGFNQPSQRSPMPPFPPTPVLQQQQQQQYPSIPISSSTGQYDQSQYGSTPPHVPSMPTPPQHAFIPLVQAPTPVPAAAAVPLLDANMLSILSSLTGAGGLALPGSKTLTPDISLPVPKVRTKLDDYEDMVLSLDLSLSNLDMNRMAILPIDHLPVQCPQCSTRFPSEGDQLNSHMDWHARRNKQERTSSGRGAHRRWLPRAEEWVNDIPVAGSSTAPDTLTGAAALAAGGDGLASGGIGPAGVKPLKTAEELQKKWVRVPSGPGAANAVCPICKEGFKREWSESEEEWVWRNAIDINGKIMHATCRQQQLTANRLARVGQGRSSSAGTKSISKSPGMTPEPGSVKVEPHPLSRSVGSATDNVEANESAKSMGSDGKVDMTEKEGTNVSDVVVKQEQDLEGDGNGGKRKAEEAELEEERKRVKVEIEAEATSAEGLVT